MRIKRTFHLFLLITIMILAETIAAQENLPTTPPVITTQNAHLIRAEHILIPTGPLLSHITHSPIDNLVAMTGADAGVYVCQTDRAERCQRITLLDTGLVHDALWSPDQLRVALNLTVRGAIIDISNDFHDTQAQPSTLHATEGVLHQDRSGASDDNILESMMWSNDGSKIYGMDSSRVIYVWDSVTRHLLRDIPAPNDMDYVWSSTHLVGWDDGQIITMQFDGQTLLPENTLERIDFDLTRNHTGGGIRGTLNEANSLQLALWHSSGEVQLYDLNEGITNQLFVTEHILSTVAWSPDGTLLATGDYTGILRIWNVGTGALLNEIPAHETYLYDVFWSPDGTRLITVSHDESVRTWAVG